MSDTNQKIEKDFRCKQCSKLLAKNEGLSVEIKCSRCGTLNSIFEKMNDQVIITDSSGKILFTNEAVEKTTGYTSKEVIGKTPKVWGGQMPPEFYKNLWSVIAEEKKPIQTAVTNRKKDGTLYQALLRISPVFGSDSEIIFYVGIETIISNN